MYTQPINNRKDWYMARYTSKDGKQFITFANTRGKAITACLEEYNTSLLASGSFCKEHGYISHGDIDLCDIPF
jgi:hypothetical protein